ncbi:MAG: hypothetical protein FK733_03240 [Asgard group archaeon]|nr:hypothetical protein [Asgard group archaeon]
MSQQKRYSLNASNSFLYQWLVIILILNLGLFAIIYFVINPIVQDSANPNLYEKIEWALFVIFMFCMFATTYITINKSRYWLDSEYIEKWSIYRPKRKHTVNCNEIVDIKIRRLPLIGDALNNGTIVLYSIKKKKKKVAMRIIGIKFPYEIYLDILERTKIEDSEKKIDEILL